MDIAVEKLGCHTTEPGLAGDNGTIEIWLIEWSIISEICDHSHTIECNTYGTYD